MAPEYSDEARARKWQGTVILSVVVDETSRARNVKVVGALGWGLDQKAIDAVRKWRFRAGEKNGRPVAVQATVEVNFKLSHPKS